VLEQGAVVAYIEEAVVVDDNDDIWQSVDNPTIRTVNPGDLKCHRDQLCLQLTLGEQCSKEQCWSLRELLCAKHEIFTLNDHE